MKPLNHWYQHSNKHSHELIRSLEAEAIFVLREVAAQFKNPVILFSGGKDSNALQTTTLLDAIEQHGLIVRLEVEDATKKKREQKNVSFLTGMISVNGIRKTNVLLQ